MDEKFPNPNHAVEEVKILQSIIARHENFSFRIKNFFAAIVAGLGVAKYSGHVHVGDNEFLIIAFVFYAAFFVWLIYHRFVVTAAIGRVKEIEHLLNGGVLASYKWSITRSISEGMPKLHVLKISNLGDLIKKIFSDLQLIIPLLVGALILIVISVHNRVDVPRSTARTSVEADSHSSVPVSGSEVSSARNETGECQKSQPCTPHPSYVYNITDTCSSPALFLLTVVGGALIYFGSNRWIKGVGAITLLSSASIVGIKEVKMENKIDKVIEISHSEQSRSLSDGVSIQLNDTRRFKAMYLGGVSNFRIAHYIIQEGDFEENKWTNSTIELRNMCKIWTSEFRSANDALILIVGATDRLPLSFANRIRYEANTGLALARAASVRDYLAKTCWFNSESAPDPKNVLLLVSGPRTTTEIGNGQKTVPPQGVSEDRRVDVWALAGVPASTIGTVIRSEKAPSPIHNSDAPGGDW